MSIASTMVLLVIAGTFWIIAGVLIIFLVTMFTLLIIDKYSKSKWFCEYFGWHKCPDNIETPDLFLLKGKCPRCKKEVLMDSNGDWF